MSLLESEQHYRSLVTATSEVVYRMSPDWSEMRRLHGKNFIADTDKPNRNWLQEYIHPEDQPGVLTAINEAIRTGSVFEMEHRVIRVDGTLGWTFSRAVPMLDAKGRLYEWFGTASDITGRKQIEETLKNLNENLEKLVAERTYELEAINLELEAFNYSAAHDLRQPLNQIGLYSQTLELQCGENLSQECLGYVRGIFKSNLRMNRLIDTLLNFSQLCRTEPKSEVVDLSSLADKVATTLKLIEPGRRGDFQITAGITAHGDKDLIRVVLENLFGNAWKFTGHQEHATIWFGATEIDGRPVYFVRDNGIGFDKKDEAKLFVPFQRLPHGEAFQGFGVGLATVERIIRRLGGSIWAEGEPDKGATFYFTLS